MTGKIVILGIILLAAAGLVYWRLTMRDYYTVHKGMTPEEVVAKIGQPDLKTNEMGMNMWFYGLHEKEEHHGSFGSLQYSFHTDCAVIYDPTNNQVAEVDRSNEKAWMVSVAPTTGQQ